MSEVKAGSGTGPTLLTSYKPDALSQASSFHHTGGLGLHNTSLGATQTFSQKQRLEAKAEGLLDDPGCRRGQGCAELCAGRLAVTGTGEQAQAA